MASIFPSAEPSRTPPISSFAGRDNNGEPPFQFNVTSYDDDGQDQRPSTPDRLSTSPQSSPAHLLHPHRSTTSRPSSIASAPVMGAENGSANGSAGGPTSLGSSPPKNPFNFKTQYISTAPIKPVCRTHLAPVLVDGRALTILHPDPWATARTPLQTQLNKRPTPNIPGTASTTTSRAARISPDTDLEGGLG